MAKVADKRSIRKVPFLHPKRTRASLATFSSPAVHGTSRVSRSGASPQASTPGRSPRSPLAMTSTWLCSPRPNIGGTMTRRRGLEGHLHPRYAGWAAPRSTNTGAPTRLPSAVALPPTRQVSMIDVEGVVAAARKCERSVRHGGRAAAGSLGVVGADGHGRCCRALGEAQTACRVGGHVRRCGG